VKTLAAKAAGQWRKRLVFHKQHTGVASIAYLDALDEALCFGRVDRLVKRPRYIETARKKRPAAWRPASRSGSSESPVPDPQSTCARIRCKASNPASTPSPCIIR